jgi:hypothetical protein
MKELGTMTNWRLYEKDSSDFALPTGEPLQIVGNVHDHPKFADGTYIRSVTVKTVDLARNKVTTGTGVYILAAIGENYADYLEEQGFTIPELESEAVAPELLENQAAESTDGDNNHPATDAYSPDREQGRPTQKEATASDNADNATDAVIF